MQARRERTNPCSGTSGAASGGDLSNGKLTLDEPRNALIYQGSATDWGRLLPLIQQMDKAPRQVMIEVTVAEVTLTNDQEFGVAWLANNADLGRFNGNISSGVLSGAGLAVRYHEEPYGHELTAGALAQARAVLAEALR